MIRFEKQKIRRVGPASNASAGPPLFAYTHGGPARLVSRWSHPTNRDGFSRLPLHYTTLLTTIIQRIQNAQVRTALAGNASMLIWQPSVAKLENVSADPQKGQRSVALLPTHTTDAIIWQRAVAKFPWAHNIILTLEKPFHKRSMKPWLSEHEDLQSEWDSVPMGRHVAATPWLKHNVNSHETTSTFFDRRLRQVAKSNPAAWTATLRTLSP